MSNETLTQGDHNELSELLCFLSIGLNGLTQRHARKYLLHGPDSAPPPRGSHNAHGATVFEVCALRIGLDHHCLGQRLISNYYRGEEMEPSLELEFDPGDQHIADLVPVAQLVRRLLERKARCECVLQSAVRLETALRGMGQAVGGGRYWRRPTMINETEPVSSLTQAEHTELAKQLCYLAIGLNARAQRYNRRYGLEGVYQPLPVMLVKEHAHYDAVAALEALRSGLAHHCLGRRLNSDYHNHLQTGLQVLRLESKTDDQHIEDLMPVAEEIRRLLEAKPPCACVLETAQRLETAIGAVRQDIAKYCY